LDINIEGIILKSRSFEILDVLPFSIIIGLDTMKAESMFTGYYKGHQFLEIRGNEFISLILELQRLSRLTKKSFLLPKRYMKTK
jgi:hypothetical protein